MTSHLNYLTIFLKCNFNDILFLLFYKTPLFIAMQYEDIDIVKLLLSNDKIDVNIPNVLNKIYTI